jgi:hypothetical protein
MESFLVLIPLVLVLVTLLYSVLYAILRAWLDYRTRMALLDKLDRNPNLLGNDVNLASMVTQQTSPESPGLRQDFVVTGLMIVAIGVGCILFGRVLRVGEFAVGTYLGGFACLLVGLAFALLGAVVKVLSRDPTRRFTAK